MFVAEAWMGMIMGVMAAYGVVMAVGLFIKNKVRDNKK